MDSLPMLPSAPVLALAGMIPAGMMALADLPNGYLQGGLGVVALGILWRVLDRQAAATASAAKAQAESAAKAAEARASADDRTAAAHERVAEAMERMAVSDAANNEIQRGILGRLGVMEKTLAHALRHTDKAAATSANGSTDR